VKKTPSLFSLSPLSLSGELGRGGGGGGGTTQHVKDISKRKPSEERNKDKKRIGRK
jgi:hypothetical protein